MTDQPEMPTVGPSDPASISPPDTTRCACCDLLLVSCGKAIEEARGRAARATVRAASGREREAQYPGICADCNTRFSAGALIEYDDELEGWRALACCP